MWELLNRVPGDVGLGVSVMSRSIWTSALVVLPIFAAPGVARADWALALSQDGRTHWGYGSSWNQDTIATARRKALTGCAPHGENCKIVLDGAGGCVALAVGLNDNAWHARQAKDRREAAQAALDQCVKDSSGDCEVKHSFCDAEPAE